MTKDRNVPSDIIIIKRGFQQMDYQKISVTMLCKQAGLHRSTFYLYYNSIDEVLREIEHDILNEIQLYADQMNDFRDAKTPEEMKKIYQDNEQRILITLSFHTF